MNGLTLSNLLPDGERLQTALNSKADSPILKALDDPENAMRFMRACVRGSYLFGRHLVPSFASRVFAALPNQGPVNDSLGPILRKVADLCIGELATNNIFHRQECHAHFHDLLDAYNTAGGDVKEFVEFIHDADKIGTTAAIAQHTGLWSKGATAFSKQLLFCCQNSLTTFIVMPCNEMLTTIIYPVAIDHLPKHPQFDKFRRFLEVHIQLDGDDHGYAALEWLAYYLRKYPAAYESPLQKSVKDALALYEKE